MSQASPTVLTIRRVAIAALILILIAPIGYVGALWLRYEYVLRPRLLQEAGRIELQPLTTSVSPGTLLPRPFGGQNGAFYYVLALNEFQLRRMPYLRRRQLNPFINEPPLSARDLWNLARGSEQIQCNFYELRDGRPRFVFETEPNKNWAFELGTDPLGFRPYVAPMRSLAQATLNWGKAKDDSNRPDLAERAYQIVAHLSECLRMHPGSFLDIQLGLELERNALHYLESLYARRRFESRLAACRRYANSVADLERRVQRKYAQMDNAEAARLILQRDREPVWRIEAAAALVESLHFRRLGRFETRTVRAALSGARNDPNPYVRRTVYYLEALPVTAFRDVVPVKPTQE